MAISLTQEVSGWQRATVLACCIAATAVLLLLERYTGQVIAPLFFLPLLVSAAFVPRWVGFAAAIAVSVLHGIAAPGLQSVHGQAGLALTLVSFTGATLFAGELVQKRRVAQALARTMKEESRVRADAAQEIRALVEGTPAAVITVDPNGKIALANAAAKRLFGFQDSTPEGEPVDRFLPILKKLLESPVTVNGKVEASGTRGHGEPFHAELWVSSYSSAQGRRLAAIIGDVTEDLRDREEAGLRQLLTSSKMIAAAVSHEIRNLTGGAAVLYDNLNRVSGMSDNPDFKALGNVLESVLKLSSDELQENSEDAFEQVQVPEVLQELRLVMEASFEEIGASLRFETARGLPPVRVDHSGLLQVFINLAQNSCRALKGVPEACLRISTYPLRDSVVVRFSDNGPGLAAGDGLFQPFASGASGTGLGLFISRSIVRTFGGELHHRQQPGECCFILELPMMQAAESAHA